MTGFCGEQLAILSKAGSVSTAHIIPLRPSERLVVDFAKLCFSPSTFAAASIKLFTSLAASLPRPWLALLGVHVTARPMASTSAPKAIHRLGGIGAGARVTLGLVPNMQNSSALLVRRLAIWTGLCIYLAVLDRTSRALLCQMAAFSIAVIGLPSLDDPSETFITTISRVEEMVSAILVVTVVQAVIRLFGVGRAIQDQGVDSLPADR
ncbi:FUSC family protein [Paraburkholderia nemoris]|uniref:FUSC family protein n=1 Tax=Paraburkholderia nemoris TaxID=2793076 RepID=UPI0038B9C1F1